MNEKKGIPLSDEELKEVTGGNGMETISTQLCESIKNEKECLESSKCTWNNGLCKSNKLRFI